PPRRPTGEHSSALLLDTLEVARDLVEVLLAREENLTSGSWSTHELVHDRRTRRQRGHVRRGPEDQLLRRSLARMRSSALTAPIVPSFSGAGSCGAKATT